MDARITELLEELKKLRTEFIRAGSCRLFCIARQARWIETGHSILIHGCKNQLNAGMILKFKNGEWKDVHHHGQLNHNLSGMVYLFQTGKNVGNAVSVLCQRRRTYAVRYFLHQTPGYCFASCRSDVNCALYP